MRVSHRSNMFKLLCAFFLLVLTLGFGCTKTKTATLSGQIQLINDSGNPANDPVDYAGIKVAIYETAELDTALVSARYDFPGVGIPISQDTEFDHREHNALYSTTSKADGSFQLKSMEPGRYNIVWSKQDWGWAYLLNCQIDEGDNDLADLTSETGKEVDPVLYPETVVTGTLNQMTFRSDHSYLIPSDATIVSHVNVEQGSMILIGQGATFRMIGGVTFGTDDEKPLTKISVAGQDVTDESRFGYIQVFGSSEIRNAVVSHSNSGIQVIGGDVSVQNLRVRNGISGLSFSGCQSLTASQITVSDIADLITSGVNVYTTQGGIDLTNCQNALIEYSVFVRCNAGAKIRELCVAEVRNNYFANNTIGAEGSTNPVNINHNHFQGNYTYDIRVFGTASPTIMRNVCLSKRGVNIGLDTLPANLNCTPTVHFNNFQCSVFAIRIMGNNMIDVDATNNYFYTTNLEILEGIIWDRTDYNPNDWSNQIIGNTAYIDYIPYMTHAVADAGITQ